MRSPLSFEEKNMRKFFGTPLQEIKSTLSGKVLFRFDHKGEFITDDPEFIERATGHFDNIDMEGKEIGERVKRTIITPPIRFDSEDIPTEPPKEETNDEPAEAFICKYCHESFETYGLRQKHYLAICPKRG